MTKIYSTASRKREATAEQQLQQIKAEIPELLETLIRARGCIRHSEIHPEKAIGMITDAIEKWKEHYA